MRASAGRRTAETVLSPWWPAVLPPWQLWQTGLQQLNQQVHAACPALPPPAGRQQRAGQPGSRQGSGGAVSCLGEIWLDWLSYYATCLWTAATCPSAKPLSQPFCHSMPYHPAQPVCPLLDVVAAPRSTSPTPTPATPSSSALRAPPSTSTPVSRLGRREAKGSDGTAVLRVHWMGCSWLRPEPLSHRVPNTPALPPLPVWPSNTAASPPCSVPVLCRAADGSGYEFLGDMVLKVDKINRQVRRPIGRWVHKVH